MDFLLRIAPETCMKCCIFLVAILVIMVTFLPIVEFLDYVYVYSCVTLVLIGYFSKRWGLLEPIIIETKEPTLGNLTVAYKTNMGPYKSVGQIQNECKAFDPKCVFIGLYYDDPETVPEDELRSAAGIVLAEDDELPDAENLRKLSKLGYKVAFFPKSNYAVITNYKVTSKISHYLAVYRVYANLKVYIYQKGLCAYPAIEVYKDANILFMFPLTQQEGYFVPEFAEDLESNATTEMSSQGASMLDVDTEERGSVTRSITLEEIMSKPVNEPIENQTLTKRSVSKGKFAKRKAPISKVSTRSSKSVDLEAKIDDNSRNKTTTVDKSPERHLSPKKGD